MDSRKARGALQAFDAVRTFDPVAAWFVTVGRFAEQEKVEVGGPGLTILELFRWVKSSRGFRTLARSRCFESNEVHRAPAADCARVLRLTRHLPLHRDLEYVGAS